MEAGNWIALATLILAALSTVAVLIYKIVSDPKDQLLLAAWLRDGAMYRDALGRGLGWVEKYFGPIVSWKAFDRAVLLALIYPWGWFLIAWALGGRASFLQEQVGADAAAKPLRWAFVLLALAAGVAIFQLVKIVGRIAKPTSVDSARARRWAIFSRSTLKFGDLETLVAASAALVLGSVLVGAVSGSGAGIGALVGAVAVAVIFVVAAAIAGGLFLSGTGAVVGSVIVAGAVAIITGAGATAASGDFVVRWALYLVLLPYLNATLDYVSLGVSRIYVGRMVRDPSTWAVARDITADAALAVAFLFLLAFSLPALVLAANAGFGLLGAPTVDWVSLAEAARRAPFTTGLMVTGMLLTTLIPTALHMTMGLTALVLRPLRRRTALAGFLEVEGGPSFGEKVVVVGWLLAAVTIASALLVGAAWGLWRLAPLVGANVGEWLFNTAMFWA